ncbi:hypothetical protein [Pseudoalteromonas byunsanensis]|uniref:Lipoprotein n=1 Tax=Pseudoalteromonas byunsanensis TaxID=327939 RepID=A0A1S1N8Z8_9GAMM|nr:hypothetical protein [Pseudoalteromonas byunsanensis]OHU97893.1 hypothetical protein BIW53_00525 [Pseudoalteromonas byunsanensis]
MLSERLNSHNNQYVTSILIVSSILLLSACQHTKTEQGKPEKHYDFDHKVHYEQTQYNNAHYLLQIKSDNYRHFLQQSVFLLRHSKRLCQGSTAQITLQQGVQSLEKLPTSPRPYQPDLIAEVRCIK